MPNHVHRLIQQAAWRGGRAMYLRARGESSNDPRKNGEYALAEALLMQGGKGGRGREVFFDIGAFQGHWTLNLLNAARRIKRTEIEVHAFEPVVSMYQMMKNGLNGHELAGRVNLNNTGLSSRRGKAEIFIYELAASGINSLYPDPSRKNFVKKTVKLTTLDSYCRKQDISHIKLVKCDTEGNDLKVLKGAASLLERGAIDFFQFEYNFRWIFGRCFLKDVFDFLQGKSYLIGKLTPWGTEFITEWHPELEQFFQANYVIAREDKTCDLKARFGAFNSHNCYQAKKDPCGK